MEPIANRRGRNAALKLYGVFGVLLVVYVGVRHLALGGMAVPPRPYVIPPGDVDFARYVCDKALYYLLGQFFMVPCVPLAGLPYLREHPLLFYGLAGGAVALVLGVCVRFVRRPPGLIGPAWMIGFMLPLLPVFASPHHLYLPGVGWAVTLMLVLRGLGGWARPAAGLAHRLRRVALWCLIVVAGGVFARATTWLGLALKTAHEVEDALVEELASAPSGLCDGDTLYVANLPLIGHYARLALEERTGRRDLRLVPLTWAPRVLGMTTPAELSWLDERTIELRVAEDCYFSGAMAQMVQDTTGVGVPDVVDCTDTYGFRARVVERGADGIRALRFTFVRPPSDPGLHLFWGSRARWACEVQPPGR